jgi:hypothetical protein
MKEAFEKMTGMPDAWTNPALMVSRNAFIQGWEAAQTEHDADATIIQYHEAAIKRLEKRIEELAQPAQEPVQTVSLADIGAAYKDIHACLTETLQLSRKQNGHPRQPAQEPEQGPVFNKLLAYVCTVPDDGIYAGELYQERHSLIDEAIAALAQQEKNNG